MARKQDTVELIGPRVLLRPLRFEDWAAWREIRERGRDWLEQWEPRLEPGAADPVVDREAFRVRCNAWDRQRNFDAAYGFGMYLHDGRLIGEVSLAVYCASKGGVVNLTRALALELAPDVRVNCVCPGYVDTDMVRRDVIEASADPAATERALANAAPLQRIAAPGEIATAILYLASPHARFMTGTALQIDGGTTAGHPRPR